MDDRHRKCHGNYPESGHRHNNVKEIPDFEDPASANSHKVTRYTDVIGTDVVRVCMDALLVFRFLDGRTAH
jgi:hypothetical protein